MARRRLLPAAEHQRHLLGAALRASGLLSVFLILGAVGLWFTNGPNLGVGGTRVVNAFFGAAMILTGMGPAPDMRLTDAAKVFLTLYAVASAVGFLGGMAVLFQPVYHRFLHRFHLELDEEEGRGEPRK